MIQTLKIASSDRNFGFSFKKMFLSLPMSSASVIIGIGSGIRNFGRKSKMCKC